MANLAGLRVLVVEDELFIAMMLEGALRDEGCVVVGPVPRVANAVKAAQDEPIDVAVLDVNLGGEQVFPVADALVERRVPFVFLTGYGGGVLPAAHADRPVLSKPFKYATLFGAIAAALEA